MAGADRRPRGVTKRYAAKKLVTPLTASCSARKRPDRVTNAVFMRKLPNSSFSRNFAVLAENRHFGGRILLNFAPAEWRRTTGPDPGDPRKNVPGTGPRVRVAALMDGLRPLRTRRKSRTCASCDRTMKPRHRDAGRARRGSCCSRSPGALRRLLQIERPSLTISDQPSAVSDQPRQACPPKAGAAESVGANLVFARSCDIRGYFPISPDAVDSGGRFG